MGRRRVELRRIEDRASRQTAFSKRRSGFLKKAHEISVLCEVEVAVIVFSPKGKLYEYSTNSNMRRILNRYEQYLSAEKELAGLNSKKENTCADCSKTKFIIESLQMKQRQAIGEDLESLDLTELQHLDQQLENGLRKIRSRWRCMLLDSIEELQQKAKLLQEQNTALEKLLKVTALYQAAQTKGQDAIGNTCNLALSLQLHDHPLTLNTGIRPVTTKTTIGEQEACTINIPQT